jgi:ankyrin repeat protein
MREVVRYLVEQGADKNVIDIGDRTPLDLAVENKHHDVAEYLRRV